MSEPPNTVPHPLLDSQVAAPAATSPTRPFYWSLRRELWENRSIYIAPLAVAAVYLLGYSISAIRLSHRIRELASLDLPHQRIALAMPYAHAGMLLLATALIVGVFYSLDALHSERRDRSIFFWKSLPVSDLTTVLSKASIPLVVLPLLIFVLVFALQLIMVLVSSAVLLLTGAGVAALWTKLPLFQMELGLLYGLAVLALWHAPIYAWLLLVSGWARRATFLWAVLPPAAIAIFERIAFGTSYFGSLLKGRLIGFAPDAFEFKTPDGTTIDPHFIPVMQFTPGKFLGSPGLWFGLIATAALLFAAVRLRRNREPI
jgi:ABC-2 type transport system permease protein